MSRDNVASYTRAWHVLSQKTAILVPWFVKVAVMMEHASVTAGLRL